jgi:hypothetical protein
MTKTLLFALAVVLCAAPLTAQTNTTTTTTTTGLTQVQLSNLPPAPTCFICDCNSQDFSCQTACNDSTTYPDFASRQQCLAACDQQQATCLSNAQVQQRAVDTQRQALQNTSPTSSTGTTAAAQ